MLIVRDKEGESAGALIKDPKPVIADEHITSLDAESAGITGDMLKRAMEGGRTAILTTHQDRKLPDTAKAQPRTQDYQRHTQKPQAQNGDKPNNPPTKTTITEAVTKTQTPTSFY